MPDNPDFDVPTRFNVEIPPDAEAGRFADFANIWHTANVFVLDFAALRGPAFNRLNEADNRVVERIVPSRVVSRIRIPPEQVFELAKALTRELERWEQETGRKPPERPLFQQDEEE